MGGREAKAVVHALADVQDGRSFNVSTFYAAQMDEDLSGALNISF